MDRRGRVQLTFQSLQGSSHSELGKSWLQVAKSTQSTARKLHSCGLRDGGCRPQLQLCEGVRVSQQE